VVKTTSNVWRKWRIDTPKHIEKAFSNDIASETYMPELYFKEPGDADEGNLVLKANFNIL